MDVQGWTRRALAAATVGIAMTLATAGPAAAGPAISGLDDLGEKADSAPARIAIEALTASSALSDVADEYTPFFYTAPTIGCGTTAPVTMTMASATTGPSAAVSANEVSFQALSAYPGVVTASGLSVVWLNTTTGASGINALDGTTEGGYPSLAKTVHTGAGTVVAALFGSVNYATAVCHVLPTVGSFFVPEEGPLPAEAAAEPVPASNDLDADTPPA
ncbi:hypothetical protein [Rhodococcus sp. NPDC058521]|uniref:hypothetical protein n=1 Tax=Rhodococcus sp. NPDC058521 TaxID=3346536 RepID=UPI003653ADBC